MAAGRTMILTLCVVIVLSISALAEGQQGAVSPPFVAAETGDQNITINCSIQNPTGTDNIAWQYTPSWTHGVPFTIYTSFDDSLKDPANFSAVSYSYQLQGIQYIAADLTIKVANPGLAAEYTCIRTPQLEVVELSSFLVLDPIQCPAKDETEYTVGTTVDITCSVHVYNMDPTTTEPIIDIFRIDQGVPLPGTTTRNDTTVTMTTSIVLAVEDDNTEYMCFVHFTNNISEYSDNCTTIYHVLHEVSEIIFDPPSSSDNPTTVDVGDLIICTGNGRPEPTIVWYNDEGGVVAEGEQLIIFSEMQKWVQPITLLCRATNSIDGGINFASVEANYTFIVTSL